MQTVENFFSSGLKEKVAENLTSGLTPSPQGRRGLGRGGLSVCGQCPRFKRHGFGMVTMTKSTGRRTTEALMKLATV